MADRRNSLDTAAFLLRWTARIGSAVSLVVLAQFLIGEPGRPTPAEWIALALFPGGVATGMLLGWRRELLGGVVAVASLAAFYAWMAALGRGFVGPWFLVFGAPAFLFLAAAALRSAADGRRASPPAAGGPA